MEELFIFGSPKFLSPVTPNYGGAPLNSSMVIGRVATQNWFPLYEFEAFFSNIHKSIYIYIYIYIIVICTCIIVLKFSLNFFSSSIPNFPFYSLKPQKDPFRFQVRIFIEDAGSHMKLATSRSYLKLYSTLPLAKLAAFLNMVTQIIEANIRDKY